MADYGGGAVLPVCAAGSQGPAARGNFGEVGGRFAGNSGREPGADIGPACAADSGIFQHPGGSLVRFAGAGGIFSENESGSDYGGFAGCGWSGTRAIFREEN